MTDNKIGLSAAPPPEEAALPGIFSSAVESLYSAKLRPEIEIGGIRPPQRLAPFSHAIGLEIVQHDDPLDEGTDGDAFGRLILLYDPQSDDIWEGTMRLVAYIQGEMDASLAADPLLPDVAWSWLEESLEQRDATHTHLGGTVTSTASVRYGDIGGVPRAFQLEMRCSWTPSSADLSNHVRAFADVLALVAGLPPEGVSALR